MYPSLWRQSFMAALGTLALSSAALAQQIPDFTADNSKAGSPAYPQTGTDTYSDDTQMRFRNGYSSFDAPLTAIATFESIGIYWAPPRPREERPDDIKGLRTRVQYRKQGEQGWSSGLPLWFDPRNKEYRGSLVGLAAGTSYEISLSLIDNDGVPTGTTASITQSTWTETANLPVSKTITLPANGSATYNVNVSGTQDGYVLYTAPADQTTIDMGAPDGHLAREFSCVRINASYVIVRGLTLKNCQRQGIEILAPSHDVIIEKNDISGFGSAPSGTEAPASAGDKPTNKIVYGTEYEAGIYCQNVRTGIADRVRRVVIQRNKIHDPRYGSISWVYAHPNSAQGITFNHCGGNHVIRYNDIYATPGHYFNDGIGGLSNFTFEGFPGADSDIHGNDISGVYDDAIESEGGNRNVRIWGNYLHHVYSGIALATTSQGPVYAFRNVMTDTVGMGNPNAEAQDDATHGTMFKLGSDQPAVSGGRIYLFHNSSLQPPLSAGLKYGPGVAGFAAHFSASTAATCNIVSRNNLMAISKYWQSAVSLNTKCGGNDLQYDAYYGKFSIDDIEVIELKGTQGHPSNKPVLLTQDAKPLPLLSLYTYDDYKTATYTTGKVYLSPRPDKLGEFDLKPASLGYGTGVYLPNFNDLNSGVDAGAHQTGKPKFEYGSAAYLNSGK